MVSQGNIRPEYTTFQTSIVICNSVAAVVNIEHLPSDLTPDQTMFTPQEQVEYGMQGILTCHDMCM
jgi:hypothetical protein